MSVRRWWQLLVGFWALVIVGLAYALACDLQVPPARYRTGPVSVKEYRVSLAALARTCPVHGRLTIGCAFKVAPQDRSKIGGKTWMVWLPRQSVGGCSVAEIRTHEYAHARGWLVGH